MTPLRNLLLFAGCALASLGCDVFEGLEDNYVLDLGPNALTVNKGGSDSATVTVTRAIQASGGFYDGIIRPKLSVKRSSEVIWVALDVEGELAPGIRFTIHGNSQVLTGIIPDGNQVQSVPMALDILFQATEDSVDYDLRIRDSNVQSNIIRLRVRPAQSNEPLFTLILEDSLSVTPGQTIPGIATYLRWINSLFTEAISLAIEPFAYPGISATIASSVSQGFPPPPYTRRVDLNITVDQSAAYGYYPFVIRATGGGYETRDTLVLNVTQQSPSAPWKEYRAIVGDRFTAVAFSDLSNGVVVGDGGVVLHTTDSGTTWETGASRTTRDLLGVAAVGANTFVACGENGTVLQSNDGGASWTAAASVPTTADLNGISFIDAQTGIIAGNIGNVLWTTNGGSSWEPRGFVPQTFNADAVGYWDAQNLLVVGYDRVSEIGIIWRTTNSGSSWTQVFLGPPNSYFDGVSCLAPNVAIAVGSAGNHRKSTDGGMTWQEIQSPFQNRDLEAISFANEFVGTVVGNSVSGLSIIFRTTSGGDSWSYESSEGVQASLFGVHMITPETGFAVGDSRRILRREVPQLSRREQ